MIKLNHAIDDKVAPYGVNNPLISLVKGKKEIHKKGIDEKAIDESHIFNDETIAQNDGFSSTDISTLPRYALVETGVATDAVASSAATTTATTTAATATTAGTIASVSGWTWAAGAVAVVGGGVAVASSGGGSSSTSSSTSVDTTAPAFTSASTAIAKSENSGTGQVIYTATATDASTITYTLKSGSDAGLTINATTGAVTLTASPNYETKSAYNFTVVATDTAGNASEKAVTFAIANLDEVAPTITSGTTATAINENSGTGQVVYTASATDTADTSAGITYALSGTDAALLNINSSTGAVTLTANPDFETQATYSFNVTASDGVNAPSIQVVTLGITNLDEVAPTITSGTTATTPENVVTSTAVYTATSTDSADIATGATTYTFSTSGGADYALFDLNSTTGAVTFKVSPDYEAPLTNDADNFYDFTIRATDTSGNFTDQNIVLTVTNVAEKGDAVIDLGTYGKLIAPVQVDGKWFYVWDMNGDGTHDWNQNANGQYNYDGSVANASGSGYQYDYATHDVLDGLFNHDASGITNTTVANVDGLFGTTNDYRYAAINGVSLALPTTGTGLANEGSAWYYLNDNQTYTDLAEIWDSSNTGYQTSGTPAGWQDGSYWSATPSSYGHAAVTTYDGIVYVDGDDVTYGYVALQVL